MKHPGKTEASGWDPEAHRRQVEAWYREHRNALVKLLAQGWIHADAEDAVEDVFVKLLLRSEDLSQVREPIAFLRRRAQNLLRDWHRQGTRTAKLNGRIALVEALRHGVEPARGPMQQVRVLLANEPKKHIRLLHELILNGRAPQELSPIFRISWRTIYRLRERFLAKCRGLIRQGKEQRKSQIPPPQTNHESDIQSVLVRLPWPVFANRSEC